MNSNEMSSVVDLLREAMKDNTEEAQQQRNEKLEEIKTELSHMVRQIENIESCLKDVKSKVRGLIGESTVTPDPIIPGKE